jgi:hypothetical protein
MTTILIFVVGVLARMIDPMTLLIAFGVAAFAATRKSQESRWTVIVIGTLLMVLASAVLTSVALSQAGRSFTFAFPQAAIANFLQVYLIALAIGAWRAKRKQENA